jgi:hypothetical protein
MSHELGATQRPAAHQARSRAAPATWYGMVPLPTSWAAIMAARWWHLDRMPAEMLKLSPFHISNHLPVSVSSSCGSSPHLPALAVDFQTKSLLGF